MSEKFEFQPTLKGEFFLLRPLAPCDFEELYTCASDPLIWEQHPQPDRYRREVFKDYLSGAISSGGALVFMDQVTGEIAGCSRYYGLKDDPSQVIIGYTFFSRKYWGGPWNREVKTLMLTHAFRFVDSVVFQIGETNIRSQRSIERIGAKLVGRKSLDGKTHVIYQMNRADFPNTIE